MATVTCRSVSASESGTAIPSMPRRISTIPTGGASMEDSPPVSGGIRLLRTRRIRTPGVGGFRFFASPPYPSPGYGYYDPSADLRVQVMPRTAEVYVDGYLVGTVD